LFGFTKQLIEIRQRQPLFHRGRFLTGAFNEELGVKDVAWLDPAAKEIEHWTDGNARCFGMLLDGRAQPTGIRRKGQDRTLLLMVNAHHETVPFVLPSVPGGKRWRLLVDTNEAVEFHRPISQAGGAVDVSGRSLALWELQPLKSPTPRSRMRPINQ
jgi:isoamylase